MQRDARQAAPMMVRRLVFSVIVVLGAAAAGSAQQPPPGGWVVIPVEDYRALRALAYPPTRPPDPPPGRCGHYAGRIRAARQWRRGVR